MNTKFTSRAVEWLSVALLASTFVLCAVGVVVTLDEIGRLPFYNTLPLVALLVNGAAGLLFWSNKSRARIIDQLHLMLCSVGQMSFSKTTFAFSNYRLRKRGERTVASEGETGHQNIPSLREVEMSLASVHSVAWGFPPMNESVRPVVQGARSTHEAHG